MDKILIGDEKPLKILLAEDNKVNQVLTLGLLSCLGYRSDLAENGKAAVEASENKAYDLILMDCQLPVLDGFQAATIIRKRQPVLPIIVAYSANVLSTQRERCEEAGMQFVLSKPITLESLSNLTSMVFDLIQRQDLTSKLSRFQEGPPPSL